ncbi:MAG: type II secretion system protein [Verrucomicrobia bacterium]|nr:MAG: type II secretion system protein [Verrucomicrobiota bacterium]
MKRPVNQARKKSPPIAGGFTLLELLVVISLIIGLSTVGIIGMRNIMSGAKQAACAENLRNIGLAMHSYAIDHQGSFPETTHTQDLEYAWIYALKSYLGDYERTRVCPADPKREARLAAGGTSYVLNSFIFVPEVGPFGEPIGPALNRLSAIPEPERTIMAFICSDRTGVGPGNDHTHSYDWDTWRAVSRDIAPNRFGTDDPKRSLEGRSNYLYVDGRVESISARELKKQIERGNNIAKPPGVSL